ncbi:hypothetical protein [Pantoea anthophila]|uniref:hypothetical protein n=1 Tax=Pantoea anthophila TaxID=470931 RepID=UPI0027803C00|nr:hypothetical protein [Pantoea anthophila]MDQ1211404.1 hypothetical protein [Pantoea anthophila]
MINKLEEKILLRRASSFAENLKGIESFTVSLLEENDFSWHKKELEIARAIDIKNKGLYFQQPVEESKVIASVLRVMKLDRCFSCCLIFEGLCGVFVRVNDLQSFLQSIFKLSGTYDLSLVFESPDGILNISDDEYEVEVYHKLK